MCLSLTSASDCIEFEGAGIYGVVDAHAIYPGIGDADVGCTLDSEVRWRGGGGGGVGVCSQKNWVGLCGPLPKTLVLFMIKICNILYPTYNLTKNLKPYL